MKRIKNTLNATEFPILGEKKFSASKTIPDQTMTMRQLLDRYARGLPLAGQKEPVYHGDVDLPELHRLDLAEIQELKENNLQRIREQRDEIQRQQHEAKGNKYPKKTASPEGGREGDKKQKDSTPDGSEADV